MFISGKTIAYGVLAGVIIIAVILATVILVILLNGAQRKIPVQYAKKMQGRKMVGGQSTFIPLKVNTAGVIPVIFASSLMSIPQIIISFGQIDVGDGIGGTIVGMLSQNNWFQLQNAHLFCGFDSVHRPDYLFSHISTLPLPLIRLKWRII